MTREDTPSLQAVIRGLLPLDLQVPHVPRMSSELLTPQTLSEVGSESKIEPLLTQLFGLVPCYTFQQ